MSERSKLTQMVIISLMLFVGSNKIIIPDYNDLSVSVLYSRYMKMDLVQIYPRDHSKYIIKEFDYFNSVDTMYIYIYSLTTGEGDPYLSIKLDTSSHFVCIQNRVFGAEGLRRKKSKGYNMSYSYKTV